ncbi:hypothetical protein CLU79DRAFT_759651 [Phycomyces nitens]|nr:hypothetical protein CLU79DRAFT_759651 [Phycomyces nitens]
MISSTLHPSSALEGVTLEMVLQNRTQSPFSYDDFSLYLELTYCAENLAFYKAVSSYHEAARLYFGDSTLDLTTDNVILNNTQPFYFSTLENHKLSQEELIRFEKLKMRFQDIIRRFIMANSSQEINIPSDIRQNLLNTHYTAVNYHPALLCPAASQVLELMRVGAFLPFVTDPKRLGDIGTSCHSLRHYKSTPSLRSSFMSNQQELQDIMIEKEPTPQKLPNHLLVSLGLHSPNTTFRPHTLPGTLFQKIVSTFRSRPRSRTIKPLGSPSVESIDSGYIPGLTTSI